MPKPIIALPILASLFIVAGVIASLWFIGSASGERDRFSSLEIAPQQADAFFAINTDPTSPQWLAVNHSLGAIGAKDPIRRAIDEALAEVNLDWEDDILPVAGDEAFFSVPDFENIEGDGGYVAGFRIADEGKAREVFAGLRERSAEEGEALDEEEYEGVTIYYTSSADLDGDPATWSDCEDQDGTIVCDDQAPIPLDPFARCIEVLSARIVALDEGLPEPEVPAECVPFFECPELALGLEPEWNLDDLDGNGTPDSCDEVSRIELEWNDTVEFGDPYQDCADLDDISDDQCEDVPPFVVAQSAGVGSAVALFDGVLALGGTPSDVKMVIDVVQGREPSAEENERLQEFREAQKEDFLMWGYADLATVWDIAEAGVAGSLDGDGASGALEPFETPVPEVTPQPTTTAAPEDGFRITSFDSEYTINANGSLQVKETISVDFGSVEKHGIARRIDTRIRYDLFDDELLDILPQSVTRDGVDEPYQTPTIEGEYFEFQVGDFNATVNGAHVYVLEYAVLGGVHQWTTEIDPYYEVVLNATGDDWGVPLESSSVTFTAPNGLLTARSCFVGPDPTADLYFSDTFEGCAGAFTDTTYRFDSDGAIAPDSGLGFLVGVVGESGAPPPLLVPNEDFGFDEDDFDYDYDPEPILPFNFDSEALFGQLRDTYDRVGFSISSTSDGFAFDLTVLNAPGYDPEGAFAPTQAFDSQLAGSAPADSMFFFAGYGLYEQSWLPLKDTMENTELDGSTLGEFFDEFADESGLDIEEDILGLLTGEYAIAGDVSGWDSDSPDISILGMFQVEDSAQAQDSLDEAGDYLQDEDYIEVDDSGGIQRWAWLGDSDTDPVGLAIDGHRLIVGYPDAAVDDAIAGSGGGLSDTSDWRRTIGLLPGGTTSIGFLSIARILDEVRNLEGVEEEFEGPTDGDLTLDDLDAIRALGFATTSLDNGFGVHLVLLVED